MIWRSLPGVQVSLGDTFERMAEIPDGSIDMVLADLPYGTTACKWDSVIPFEPLWAAYKRICKPDAAIVLTASQPFTSALVMSNPRMFKYDWTWQKPKGTGHLNAKKMPMKDKEDVLVFYANQCTYNPQFSSGTPFKKNKGGDPTKSTSQTDCYGAFTNQREDNPGRRYPKQVINFGFVERGSVHPTPKPVALRILDPDIHEPRRSSARQHHGQRHNRCCCDPYRPSLRGYRARREVF